MNQITRIQQMEENLDKSAKAVKDFILEMSEKARIKRRTMTMLDIGAGGEVNQADLNDLLD